MVRTTIRISVTAATVALAGSAHGAVFNITPANSIQATINMAADGDTINFAAGTYNQTANLGARQLTLAGAGIGQTIISAAFLNDSVLRGSGIGTNLGGLVIRDMTIADGQTPSNALGVGYPVDGAGLVLANSTVRVERVRFESNHAYDDGGGMYTDSSAVTIIDCEFEGNTADGSGGAYLANLGTLSISGTQFIDNHALDVNADGDAGWGGALYLISQSSSFLITGSTFDSNIGIRGGAVYTESTTGTFASCTFDDNDATEGFGGVFYSRISGTLAINDSTLRRNHAATSGGVIYADDIALFIRRSVLVANSATSGGGALRCLATGSLDIERCGFFGNATAESGGAINASLATNIRNSLFVGNTAGSGGALNMTLGPSSVSFCTFYGNDANAQPIARTNASGGITMRNCLATQNTPIDDIVGGTGWTIQYSNIERSNPGTTVSGAGNINEPPLFMSLPSPGGDMMWGTMDDDFGNLRLAAGSPGIDAGDSLNVLTILDDYNGDDRNLDDPATPNTGVSAWALCVDMGAYEYQPPTAPPACPGNANGDTIVNFDDINAVIANWLNTCP